MVMIIMMINTKMEGDVHGDYADSDGDDGYSHGNIDDDGYSHGNTVDEVMMMAIVMATLLIILRMMAIVMATLLMMTML